MSEGSRFVVRPIRRVGLIAVGLFIFLSLVPGAAVYPQGKPIVSSSEQQPAARRTALVTVVVRDSPVKYAVNEIVRQAKLQAVYDQENAAFRNRRTFNLVKVSPDSALKAVLSGTNLEVRFSQDGESVMIRTRNDTTKSEIRPNAGKGTVRGIVIDSASGQGIRGVSVGIPSVKSVAITDGDGAFVMPDIPVGTHLVTFKLLGYRVASQSVTVTQAEEASVRVTMAQTATSLSEVVTTATGSQRRVEVGNDIVVLNVDSIMRVSPVATIGDLLANRVPGVTARLNSGEPGASRLIRIRTPNSVSSSNDPMVIVDGVQIFAQQEAPPRISGLASPLNSSYSVTLSPLDQIDPNSIAKLEVFKGASAVATWGSNAANGVIVITTKQGRSGPPEVSMTIEQGIEYIPGRWPDNYYAWGTNNILGNRTHCSASIRLGCTVDSVVQYQLLNDSRTTILGTGHRQRYTMNVTGGSNLLRYSITGSIHSVLGLVKLSEADRVVFAQRGWSTPSDLTRPQANTNQSGTARIDMEMGQYRIAFATTLTGQETRKTPLTGVLGRAASMDPTIDSFDASGNLVELGSAILSQIPDVRRRTKGQVTRSMNTVNIRRRFFSFINSDFSGGFDVSSKTESQLLGRNECFVVTNSCNNSGSASNLLERTFTRSLTVKGSSDPLQLGSRYTKVVFLAGINYYREQAQGSRMSGSSIPFGATSVNEAETHTIDYLRDDRITAGMYTGVRFALFDQIYIPFELRQDAGSALGQRVRPTFPKLSFSYLLSDNQAFKNISALKHINELRIRTSYGRAGRQPPAGANLRTYTMTSGSVENIAGDLVRVGGIGNPELLPERAQDFDFGFELSALDNRMQVVATWYNSHTKDLLVSQTLPSSLGGVRSQYINLGDTKARGQEFSLVLIPIETRSVVWTSSINYASAKQTLTRLGLGTRLKGIAFNDASPTTVIDNVYALGYPLRGIWARPLIAFADIDDNGNITEDEVQFADSAIFLGTGEPKFTSTIEQTVTFFGKLTANIAGTYQHDLTKVNRSGGVKYLYANNDPNAPLSEQAYQQFSALAAVQTTSSFTVDYMTINWIIPKPYTTKLIGATRSVTLAVKGTNLGLWTSFRHKDPNVTSIRPAGVLPTPRTWSISASIR